MRVILIAAVLFFSAAVYSQGKPDHIWETGIGFGSGVYGKRIWNIGLEDTFTGNDFKFSNHFEYENTRNSKDATLEDFNIFKEAIKVNFGNYIFGGMLSSKYDESEDFIPGLEYSALIAKSFILSPQSDAEFGLMATNSFHFSRKYKRIPFVMPYAAYNLKSSHSMIRIGVPLILMYFDGGFSTGFIYIPVLNSYCFVKYNVLPNLSVEGFADSKFDRIESEKFNDDDRLNIFAASAGSKVNFYFTKYTGITMSGGYHFFGREWISDSWKNYNNEKKVDNSFFVKAAFSIIL